MGVFENEVKYIVSYKSQQDLLKNEFYGKNYYFQKSDEKWAFNYRINERNIIVRF